jgi:hypothetical protein
MDRALLAIAETAEKGGAVPRLAIFAGSVVVYGLPIGAADAARRMRESIAHAIYDDAKPKRRERDEVFQWSYQVAESQIADLGGSALGYQSEALSLGDVLMILIPTGEQITTKVVRVPFGAVDSWFAGSFEAKSESGGGFVGGFVSMPVD